MTDLINYLAGLFSRFYDFIVSLALWFLQKLWSFVVDIATYIIDNHIPDPCCIAESVLLMQWLSTSINSGGVFQWLAWSYGLIQFDYGLKLVLCALAARFILRRIPFIG